MLVIVNNNFDDSVKEGLNVIDFYTEYCSPCKAFEPVLEQLSEENTAVNFLTVDAIKNREISRKFRVMSSPTIIFYKNGDILEVLHGIQDKDFMQELIEKYIM